MFIFVIAEIRTIGFPFIFSLFSRPVGR